VSRQHIVNIDWVKETRHELGGGMLMILRNGLEIGVSRRRAAELRASAQL
ncbi:LytTR family DNA-binding domain-containing protein, partial [Acinetobacter baumannii]